MNLFLRNITILIVILLSVNACSKDDYLTDSGLSKAQTPLTAYDYLQNHRYNMFDSLITLIDHYGIKDSINSAGTFFAPNDYNIRAYLIDRRDKLREETEVEDTTYTFNDLLNDPTVTSHSILQYVFNERITLTEASTRGVEYTSIKGDVITIKKKEPDDRNTYYQYNDTPIYFLFYSKDENIFEDEVCQTSDILTQNGSGTVLHVLNNSSMFNIFREIED